MAGAGTRAREARRIIELEHHTLCQSLSFSYAAKAEVERCTAGNRHAQREIRSEIGRSEAEA